MSNQVDFLPFAIGNSANVLSQSDYAALAAILTGFQSGTAKSAQVNKALRQATVMAAVLANFIANNANVNVLDNGDTGTLLTNFVAALKAANASAGFLNKSNNLSDVLSAATALANLGGLAKSNNLSDLASIPTALANLGLGGFVKDTGTANAVVIASPVILADGVPFLVKFAAKNTANVTIKVGNYPANPLVGIAGALNGGEIAAGGYGWVVYSSTLAAFVLVSPVYGGALQVGTALQPKHAVQLAQVLPVAKISNFSASGVNQTISGGVDTALIPTTEAFDDLNEYSTSTGKFTATSAGTYVFSATAHGTTTTTGRRILMIFINGVEQYRLQENAQMRGDCSICGTSGPMRLNAGDYAQVYYNTSIADTTLGFSFGGRRIK